MMLLRNAFKMHEGAVRRLFSSQERSTLMQTWDLQPVRVMAIQAAVSDVIPNNVGRGTYTASSAPETQDGYTDEVKSKLGVLNRKRAGLRPHGRTVDQLNKGWYKEVIGYLLGAGTRSNAPAPVPAPASSPTPAELPSNK